MFSKAVSSTRRSSTALKKLSKARVTTNLRQQQAFVSFLKSRETNSLRKVIAEAEKSLGESKPLATSVKGMRKLLDSQHFKVLIKSQSFAVTNFLYYSDKEHNLKDLAEDVIRHEAPNIHPNSNLYPVPLPFRGLIISLLGGLIREAHQPSNWTETSVQAIAEINGLMEAAINIHRNITGMSGDKMSNSMNKMAVLGGDYCLAKACQLLANLSSPEAVDKISFTLSAISQQASADHEHSNLLLKSCCETLVILQEEDRQDNQNLQIENQSKSGDSKLQQVADFTVNLTSAHTALLDGDNDLALAYKVRCLDFLNTYGSQSQEQENSSGPSKEDCRHLLISLVEAFLPVESD